ncbi:MAG: Eco57I restriction-modification methylase domain-containing protein, partial [Candidatus Thorarchaeota archaeon]
MNASLTREQNKLTGSFYTPQGIAEDIAGSSISKWLSRCTGVDISKHKPEQFPDHERRLLLKALSGVKILDPSVGDGVFLLAAGEWLLNTRIALGDTNNIVSIREQIAMKSLHGVDIQELSIQQSTDSLRRWLYNGSSSDYNKPSFNLKVGNSLIGNIRSSDTNSYVGEIPKTIRPFQWYKEFTEVFASRNGFDVIIGNPPYGNLLSQSEKEIIRNTYDYDIMSGREGSWNAATLFIVRVFHLLNRTGELGFLVPNSILRVGQFLKTRKFLLEPLNLWGITDDGKPFDDVTLEMVSIFCSAGESPHASIEIRSRRDGLVDFHRVSRNALASSRIYSIYND